ncbi:MAG: NUDIX domain-containing protein [Candidatus Moranbacteria bacterium]|nr:NUDIX domain-containing protein [Candidatus Moranbacteria bacterium]
MSKPIFTIGVFAAIFDDENRILFCHRTDCDLWNLPGGKLEHGEAPWDCVIREVKEETGLDTVVERLSGIYSKPAKDEIVFQYVCRVTGGEMTLNDEADKIKYFALNDIPSNTSPKQIERIKDVLEGPDGVVAKTQSGKSSFELINEGLL